MRNQSRFAVFQKLSDLMWPDFVEVAGHIFAKGIASKRLFSSHRLAQAKRDGLDRTGVEAFEHNLHIGDAFGEGQARSRKPEARSLP